MKQEGVRGRKFHGFRNGIRPEKTRGGQGREEEGHPDRDRVGRADAVARQTERQGQARGEVQLPQGDDRPREADREAPEDDRGLPGRREMPPTDTRTGQAQAQDPRPARGAGENRPHGRPYRTGRGPRTRGLTRAPGSALERGGPGGIRRPGPHPSGGETPGRQAGPGGLAP